MYVHDPDATTPDRSSVVTSGQTMRSVEITLNPVTVLLSSGSFLMPGESNEASP